MQYNSARSADAFGAKQRISLANSFFLSCSSISRFAQRSRDYATLQAHSLALLVCFLCSLLPPPSSAPLPFPSVSYPHHLASSSLHLHLRKKGERGRTAGKRATRERGNKEIWKYGNAEMQKYRKEEKQGKRVAGTDL